MSQMIATVTATLRETRVLAKDSAGDRLIARLPPLAQSHRWGLKTLLESLALWSHQPLRVVLFVEDSCDWEQLGLCDALGLLTGGLHLDVEIVPHEVHQRSRSRSRSGARRLTGLGSFAPERQKLRQAGHG